MPVLHLDLPLDLSEAPRHVDVNRLGQHQGLHTHHLLRKAHIVNELGSNETHLCGIRLDPPEHIHQRHLLEELLHEGRSTKSGNLLKDPGSSWVDLEIRRAQRAQVR